jgi:hypothetical protein
MAISPWIGGVQEVPNIGLRSLTLFNLDSEVDDGFGDGSLNWRQPRERQSPDWHHSVHEFPAFLIKKNCSQKQGQPIGRLAFPGNTA